MPSPCPSSSVPISHMYFLFHLHFLFPYFPSFRYFTCLSRTSPKILLSMPAPGHSSSVLTFLSLYPSFPAVLPGIVDFLLTYGFYVYCVCNAFVFPFVLLGFSWKLYLYFDDLFFLLIWFLFIQCFTFCFEFNASTASVCIFVFISIDISRVSYVTSLAWRDAKASTK